MKTKKLPKRFYRFFWDIKPDKLDAAKYSEYVIERLLNLGDLEAVKWTWDNFGRKKIIAVVKTGRQITPKTANFFIKLLALKPEEVFCFRRQSQLRPSVIWPY